MKYGDLGYSAWIGAHSIDSARSSFWKPCYKLNCRTGKFKNYTVSDVIKLMPAETKAVNLMEEMFSVAYELTKRSINSKIKKPPRTLDTLLKNAKNLTGKAYTSNSFDNAYSKYADDPGGLVRKEFPEVATNDVKLDNLNQKRFIYDYPYEVADMGDSLLKIKKEVGVDTVVYITNGGLEPGALAAYELESKLVPLDYHTKYLGIPGMHATKPTLIGDEKEITGKNVMLVDDDIGFGGTISCVIAYAKELEPERLFVAVPMSLDMPDSYGIRSKKILSDIVYTKGIPYVQGGREISGHYSPMVFECSLD